jgi:hypothetical protein
MSALFPASFLNLVDSIASNRQIFHCFTQLSQIDKIPTMKRSAHFRVDPRLAALLGENYRSSEHAIKELIDNAWDAEATEVHVTLPAILSEDPVTVRDDGTGMKTAEVETEYLRIASARFSRKGDRSPNLNRLVKGRKGIGKFAGLILASEMRLETSALGVLTRVQISKAAILDAAEDLEDVPLPIESIECKPEDHGTQVTLTRLNENLLYPKTDKLKELLAFDYGRETDFAIFVNGERVFHHDIQGESFKKKILLPNGKTADVSFTVATKPLPGKKAGLIVRVGGKTVGRPHCFGLEFDDTLSDRLRRRIVGEVNLPADAIELTAAGGDVIESDKGFEHLTNNLQADLKETLAQTHTNEFNLAKGRWTQQMKRRLENVPEHRRTIAEDRLHKLISRSYQEGEKEERIQVLVDLVLDAMEIDEYWTVCQSVQEAEKVDVFHFADALERFGLCDLAFMGYQAKCRLEILDHLLRLSSDARTTEKQMHVALQTNLWVLGPEYSLMSSNKQLRSIIEEYAASSYKGTDEADRPDLLLAGNILKQHLLIEFKRPSIMVGRDAENQAKKYADTLTGRLAFPLEILVLGGSVDPKLQDEYTGKKTRFSSYPAIIASARTQLEWLLDQLNEPPSH